MPLTTFPDLLPYPVDLDTPDIPRDMRLLAQATQNALLRAGVPRFATIAERDAWYASIPGPPARPMPGDQAYVSEIGAFTYFEGTPSNAWVLGYFIGVRRETDTPVLATAGLTKNIWESAETQPPQTHPLTWAPGEVTITRAGTYSIQASAAFDAGTATHTWIILGINTNRGYLAVPRVYSAGGVPLNLTNSVVTTFMTGDWVTTEVAAGLDTTMHACTLRVSRVGSN